MLRIPNGMMIPKTDLNGLMNFIGKLRIRCQEARQEEQLKLMVKMVINEMDSRAVGLRDRGEPVLSKVMQDIALLNREIKNSSSSQYSFELKLSFLPVRDKILIQFFSSKDFYLEVFEHFPEISEYSFVTGETPEGISEEELKQREKDWTDALELENISLQDAGLQVLIAENVIEVFSVDQIVQHLPTFEERVSRMVLAIEEDDYLENTPYEEQSLAHFQIYLKSSSATLRQQENTSRVRQILNPRPRLSDLM